MLLSHRAYWTIISKDARHNVHWWWVIICNVKHGLLVASINSQLVPNQLCVVILIYHCDALPASGQHAMQADEVWTKSKRNDGGAVYISMLKVLCLQLSAEENKTLPSAAPFCERSPGVLLTQFTQGMVLVSILSVGFGTSASSTDYATDATQGTQGREIYLTLRP